MKQKTEPEQKFKQKKKRGQPAFILDFITALTVNECREALEDKSGRRLLAWEQVYVSENTPFSVALPITVLSLKSQSVKVLFVGHLDTTGGGTRVHGEIDGESRQRLAAFQWEFLLISLALVFAGLLAVSSRGWGALAVIVLAAALIPGAAYQRWKILEEHTYDLVDWVRDQLYFLPGEEHETEGKIQPEG
jgi:hypothetical protein